MRKGYEGKSLNTRGKSAVGRGRCGTAPLKPTFPGSADFFPEGEDAEALLNTAQGNVEGVEFFGLSKDSVQTDIKQVQFIQERGLMGLLNLVGGVGKGLAKMFGVSGQGREGKPVLGGQ